MLSARGSTAAPELEEGRSLAVQTAEKDTGLAWKEIVQLYAAPLTVRDELGENGKQAFLPQAKNAWVTV